MRNQITIQNNSNRQVLNNFGSVIFLFIFLNKNFEEREAATEEWNKSQLNKTRKINENDGTKSLKHNSIYITRVFLLLQHI